MAGLTKPESCLCGSTALKRQFDPERWVCVVCDAVVVSRKTKIDSRKCRDCGVPRGTVLFKPKKNQCITCAKKTLQEWKAANVEHLQAYRHRPGFVAKRRASVRKAVQKSPAAFLRHHMHHLTKKCNYRRVENKKLNPACLDVQIDFDYVWALWESQGGLCALSGLQMVYKFKDLCAVSIDRKDSSLGYVPGNVQLVCQWVNKAKGNNSGEQMRAVLGKLSGIPAVPVCIPTRSTVLALAEGVIEAIEAARWWADGPYEKGVEYYRDSVKIVIFRRVCRGLEPNITPIVYMEINGSGMTVSESTADFADRLCQNVVRYDDLSDPGVFVWIAEATGERASRLADRMSGDLEPAL